MRLFQAPLDTCLNSPVLCQPRNSRLNRLLFTVYKPSTLGNGRNTISRVLFGRRELTEFCGKLGEFCEKLGEFALVRSAPKFRGQKSTQTFFVQSFSTTLRVMDVRTENRGRPHQKVHFPAAPVVGRNFLTPGHPGVRVRNVHGKSGPKS